MSEQQSNSNQQQQQSPPSSLWEHLVLDISQTSTSAPLNQLICYLDYAVHGDELTPQQALAVMDGQRQWLLSIKHESERTAALMAFDEVEMLKDSVAYVTREFVREDCGINGAIFSDADCDVVIAEVRKLALESKFKHSGVYWIANALAGKGLIHPQLPKRWRRY